MGFSVNTLNLCNKISTQLKGTSVLSLGNPFISNKTLRKSTTKKEIREKIISLGRDIQSSFLFKQIYKVDKFSILDISNDEGAEYIHDLNDLIIDKSILNQYDYVIDFGTQEHVFNNNIFLLNVFNLLKDKGNYIFELPANCNLEHGFRQYSPTFFYDLCYANKDFLSIEWLSVHSRRCGLNMLPLYESLDKYSSKTIGGNFYALNFLATNNGFLTGSSLALLNNLASDVSVLGLISKKESKELKFKVNQCIYRNFSLSEILIKEKNKKQISQNLKSFIKKVIINFPLPSFAKFKLITIISKVIIELRLNKRKLE